MKDSWIRLRKKCLLHKKRQEMIEEHCLEQEDVVTKKASMFMF